MMVVEGVEEGIHMGFGVVGISHCNCVNVQKKQHMAESKVTHLSENGRNVTSQEREMAGPGRKKPPEMQNQSH